MYISPRVCDGKVVLYPWRTIVWSHVLVRRRHFAAVRNAF